MCHWNTTAVHLAEWLSCPIALREADQGMTATRNGIPEWHHRSGMPPGRVTMPPAGWAELSMAAPAPVCSEMCERVNLIATQIISSFPLTELTHGQDTDSRDATWLSVGNSYIVLYDTQDGVEKAFAKTFQCYVPRAVVCAPLSTHSLNSLAIKNCLTCWNNSVNVYDLWSNNERY